MNEAVRDTVHIKSNDKWLKLHTLDKQVNPEFFRIDWDEQTPSFRALADASSNKAAKSIKLNDVETKCYVTMGGCPNLAPDSIMFATVTLTPCDTSRSMRKS